MMKNALGIKKVLKRRSRWERKQHAPLYMRGKRRAFWEKRKSRTILNNLKINIYNEVL